jgi:LAS superfamily LD-carboxypeptidase LdcB
MIEFAVTAGLDDRCIDYDSCEVPVHQDIVPYIEVLRVRAAQAGFTLALASGYRSFDRQLAIWNGKAEGHRPLLGDDGQPLDAADLSPTERLFAILRWSALPGGSRHHWGTDIDVYDADPSRQGYQVQLTHEETRPDGVHGEFHQWLDAELSAEESAFFRPYTQWSGGVAPEPWHLSCAPLSAHCQRSLNPKPLRDLLAATDIVLKKEILAHFDEIYERFIWVDWQRYPSGSRGYSGA